MQLPPRRGGTDRGRVVDLGPLDLAALLAADARAEDKTAAFASGATDDARGRTIHGSG
ncbi:MAG TPA: hypothetical protein VKZ79_09330 [Alphaproteobacteria bacterium]|nr:hypothetical protein [Alphaproteobacteria bacterium]